MRFERGRTPGSNTRAGNEETGMINRKLIRPTLSEIQDQMGTRMQRRKPAPPEQTNAENFYYIKQMQARTPMVVVLDTGDEIRGVIEWYDKNCIKVHRANEPNLLIMKSAVRFMYKQSENKNNGDELPGREPGNE
jgi:host factor-I protein